MGATCQCTLNDERKTFPEARERAGEAVTPSEGMSERQRTPLAVSTAGQRVATIHPNTTINCKHGRHHHHAICSAAAVLVPWLRLATAQSRMHHVRTLNRTRRKMNDAPFQCPVCATPATQLPKGGVGQLKRVNTRQGARLLTRQAAPAFSCRQAALRVAAAAQGENARTKGGSVENGCNEYKSAGDQHAAVL